jgi:hypothetical protein
MQQPTLGRDVAKIYGANIFDHTAYSLKEDLITSYVACNELF